MSYFVFGAATTEDVSCGRIRIKEAMEKQAAEQQFHVFVNERIPQPVVPEMLDEQVGRDPACSFLITSQSSEDTSDSVVSPFCCSIEHIGGALEAIEKWAAKLLLAMPTISLSLFVTEGYETVFAVCNSAVSGWASQLAETIKTEGEIPSLRINLKISLRQ